MTAADIGSLTRRLADDRVEVRSRTYPEGDHDHQGPSEWTGRSAADKKTPTAEQVAGVIAGISSIGEACEALIRAGWPASLAGNRITVNDEVLAQFIAAGAGADAGAATWVVYPIAGAPSLWVVGRERQP